mmetsp:Transcript_31387/g.95951  ORF Transcript_31387/g.95951 Transcript_31387/m.95951 type:complete len:228 (+) Transcript_31387:884-1567(+)|eukprot:scaffold81933_cov28-Tisochrysis_lutea.AAC.2
MCNKGLDGSRRSARQTHGERRVLPGCPRPFAFDPATQLARASVRRIAGDDVRSGAELRATGLSIDACEEWSNRGEALPATARAPLRATSSSEETARSRGSQTADRASSPISPVSASTWVTLAAESMHTKSGSNICEPSPPVKSTRVRAEFRRTDWSRSNSCTSLWSLAEDSPPGWEVPCGVPSWADTVGPIPVTSEARPSPTDWSSSVSIRERTCHAPHVRFRSSAE